MQEQLVLALAARLVQQTRARPEVLSAVQLAKFYGMRAIHLRGETSVGPVSLGLKDPRRGEVAAAV